MLAATGVGVVAKTKRCMYMCGSIGRYSDMPMKRKDADNDLINLRSYVQAFLRDVSIIHVVRNSGHVVCTGWPSKNYYLIKGVYVNL